MKTAPPHTRKRWRLFKTRNMVTNLKIFVIFTILTICRYSCAVPLNDGVKIDTDKLILINYSDTNYYDLAAWIHDTITDDGWRINYYVKDDSTRYKDIYIQWSKGNIHGLCKREEVLDFRRYFIPVIVGENNSNIFLSHGCGTACQAILVLGKDSLPTYTDYLNIVNYNIPLGKLIYVTQNSWTHEEEYFELAIVDLKAKKEYKEKYNNLCFGKWQYKPSCIDTVIFEKNKIMISTTLIDKNDRNKEIKDNRIINIK